MVLTVRADEGGFTLIELLVTVSILAAVAFVAAGNYTGVSEHANDQLVRTEMQEIAQALRQFRQDTGYYPKRGPFALEDDDGNLPHDELPSLSYVDDLDGDTSDEDAQRRYWFYSPANFWLLLTDEVPLENSDGTAHQLAVWDEETGRGWRGPYLKGFADGYVNVSSDIYDDDNRAAGESSGSPLETSGASEVRNIPGLADPFEMPPDSATDYLAWSAEVGGDTRDYWGRPYLLFGLDDKPWLVSFGPDGKYDTDDDIILEIE